MKGHRGARVQGVEGVQEHKRCEGTRVGGHKDARGVRAQGIEGARTQAHKWCEGCEDTKGVSAQGYRGCEGTTVGGHKGARGVRAQGVQGHKGCMRCAGARVQGV